MKVEGAGSETLVVAASNMSEVKITTPAALKFNTLFSDCWRNGTSPLCDHHYTRTRPNPNSHLDYLLAVAKKLT